MYKPILRGVKVVELANVVAGPSVGMFLAELGAEVLKVEPLQGDITRAWKVPEESPTDPRSSYFHALNWGKSHVFADFNAEEDRIQVQQYLAEADIILSSFKPGDAQKWDFHYKAVSGRNPRVVYASISGYGQHQSRVGFDALIQAESGFMWLNREPNGTPLKMPVALMDVLAAHHLKELILTAWIHRLTTQEGAEVHVSLFEAGVSSLINQASSYLYAGVEPKPLGSEHPHIYPYGCVMCLGDGKQVMLAIGNDAQFKRLCSLLERESLCDDPRFTTNVARSTHRRALEPFLNEAFQRQMDSTSFLARYNEAHLPIGIISTVPEALSVYTQQGFYMHQDHQERALPMLAGTINGKPAASALNAPPKNGVSLP